MRDPWRRLACLIALAVAAQPALPASADGVTVRLHHRQAAEILPVVRPLLGPLGAASGTGDRLFLYDDPERLAFLRRVVRQLDQPPVWLVLHAVLGDRPPGAGPRQRGATTHPPRLLSLRVATGRPAFLEISERREERELWAAFSGETTGVLERRRDRSVRRGFQVTVAPAGGAFELAILPRWEEITGPDGARTGYRVEAATWLRLRPGRWVALNPPPRAAGRGGIRSRTGSTTAARPILYFRLDPVPPG